jgi:hypothetical protein
LLALALVGSLGSKCRSQEPLRAVDQKPSMQEVSDAFRMLLDLKGESYQYHQMLHDATHRIAPLLPDQPWVEVDELLQKLDFRLLKSGGGAEVFWRQYRVKKKAVTFPNERSLDLELHLDMRYADPKTRLPRDAKVYRVQVLLVADCRASLAELRSDKPFPLASVIDLGLNSEELAEEGAAWPILKKVSVEYSYLFNRWDDRSPCGFKLVFEFAASDSEDVAGKAVRFDVASGLDPRQAFVDRYKPVAGFKPRDILGDLEYRGGGEWWRGTPDEVAANRRKFLMTRN